MAQAPRKKALTLLRPRTYTRRTKFFARACKAAATSGMLRRRTGGPRGVKTPAIKARNEPRTRRTTTTVARVSLESHGSFCARKKARAVLLRQGGSFSLCGCPGMRGFFRFLRAAVAVWCFVFRYGWFYYSCCMLSRTFVHVRVRVIMVIICCVASDGFVVLYLFVNYFEKKLMISWY